MEFYCNGNTPCDFNSIFVMVAEYLLLHYYWTELQSYRLYCVTMNVIGLPKQQPQSNVWNQHLWGLSLHIAVLLCAFPASCNRLLDRKAVCVSNWLSSWSMMVMLPYYSFTPLQLWVSFAYSVDVWLVWVPSVSLGCEAGWSVVLLKAWCMSKLSSRSWNTTSPLSIPSTMHNTRWRPSTPQTLHQHMVLM